MPAKARGSRRAAKKTLIEDDSTLASATQATQDSMGLTQRSQPPVIKTLGLPFDKPEEVELWDGFAEDDEQEASAQCPICHWIFRSRPDLPAMYAAASCAQRCRPGKPPRHHKNDWNTDGCPGADPCSWRAGADVEILVENKWCAAQLVTKAKEGTWVVQRPDKDSSETKLFGTAEIRPRPEALGKNSTSGAATVDTVAAAAGGCDIDDDDGIDCDWGDANSGDDDEPAQALNSQQWGKVAAPAAPPSSSAQSTTVPVAAVAAASAPPAPAPAQQISEISGISGLSGPASQQLVEPRDQPDSLGSLASLGAGFPQGHAHDPAPTPAALPAPSDSVMRPTARTRQPSGAKGADHTSTAKLDGDAEVCRAAPGNSDGTTDRDTPLTQGSFAVERITSTTSTRGAKPKPKPRSKCPTLLVETGTRRQRCDDISMRLAKRVRAALPDMSQPTQLQHRVEVDVHDELVQRCAEYDMAAARFAKCIRTTAPDIASQELHGLENDMRSAVVQMLQ